MTAQVIDLATERRKRMARSTRSKRGDVCACGCGGALDVDKRCAYDIASGVAYRYECWARVECGAL